jgi:N-glycosylase/DNA lyase
VPAGELYCPEAALDLAHTLDCGQAFRWRRAGDAWIGVVDRRVFRLRRLDVERVEYRGAPAGGDPAGELAAYLRLDVDLAGLQAELAALDARVGEAIEAFPGLRVLRQPALETLLTFVCSPASNIIRITRSIDLLARLYGEPIATIDNVEHRAFPTLERLAATEPGELARTTGLGFRGPNLRRVASTLLDRPPDWAESLATLDYESARREMIGLPSIGPKIADCVALFGLAFDEAVPVDTHVWGLAHELFGARFATRTLTPATYDLVRCAYVERYGRWAGWAQQYLYHGRRVARVLPMPSTVSLTGA